MDNVHSSDENLIQLIQSHSQIVEKGFEMYFLLLLAAKTSEVNKVRIQRAISEVVHES
jgi:hypothetical protein